MDTPSQLQIEKMMFFPICNRDEIERIFGVKDGRDYLLKLRADTIVDNMRLFRVFRNRSLAQEGSWSLEEAFDAAHYDAVVQRLSCRKRRRCSEVVYGNVFSNDPNGSIFKSPYGPIITISESLRYFLEFAHLCVMDFNVEVPPHVRINALRVAVRVMLKTEALDFLMDPRGILPSEVSAAIRKPIPYQLQFIAGHEFAHYILGHISEGNVSTRPLFWAIASNDDDYGAIECFNQSQKDEFDADVAAIALPAYSRDERHAIVDAALLWFGCLELYEKVVDQMFPRSPYSFRTHPAATERFQCILENALSFGCSDRSKWTTFRQSLDSLKLTLSEDVELHADMYETYGSVYLDAPNTKWRGPKLVDRVDYY